MATTLNTKNIFLALNKAEFPSDLARKTRAQAILADQVLAPLRDPLKTSQSVTKLESSKTRKESELLEASIKSIVVDVLPQLQIADTKSGSTNYTRYSESLRSLAERLQNIRNEEQQIEIAIAELKTKRDDIFRTAYENLAGKPAKGPHLEAIIQIGKSAKQLAQRRIALQKHNLRDEVTKLCTEIRGSIAPHELTEKTVRALTPQ